MLINNKPILNKNRFMEKLHHSFFRAFMKITSIKFMKSLVLVFVMCFAISIPALPAERTSISEVQAVSVTGTVTDPEGNPMPGVTILDFYLIEICIKAIIPNLFIRS